jgi:hypothetical protein
MLIQVHPVNTALSKLSPSSVHSADALAPLGSPSFVVSSLCSFWRALLPSLQYAATAVIAATAATAATAPPRNSPTMERGHKGPFGCEALVIVRYPAKPALNAAAVASKQA